MSVLKRKKVGRSFRSEIRMIGQDSDLLMLSNKMWYRSPQAHFYTQVGCVADLTLTHFNITRAELQTNISHNYRNGTQ